MAKTFKQVQAEVMRMARKTGMDESAAIATLRKRLKKEGIAFPKSMATDAEYKKQIMDSPSTSTRKKGGKVTGPTPRPKNRKMAEVKSDLKKVSRVVGKSLILPYAAVTGNLGPAVKSLYDEAPKMKTGGSIKKKSVPAPKSLSQVMKEEYKKNLAYENILANKKGSRLNPAKNSIALQKKAFNKTLEENPKATKRLNKMAKPKMKTGGRVGSKKKNAKSKISHNRLY